MRQNNILYTKNILYFFLVLVFFFIVEQGYTQIIELHHPRQSQQINKRFHDQQVAAKEQKYLERISPLVAGNNVEISISKQVNPFHLLVNQAWQEYHQNNFNKALSFFKKVVQMAGGSDLNNARLGLAYTYLQLKKVEEALVILETLFKEGYRSEEIREVLVEKLLALARWEKALSFIHIAAPALKQHEDRSTKEIIHQLYPDNHDLTALLAWSALQEENYPEAENYFMALEGSAIPLSKNTLKQLTNLYEFFIKQAMKEGHHQEALDYLKRAKKNNVATPELLAIYAWGCYRQGDYVCAEKSFASLLQQQPARGEYVDGLIYSLHKQQKNKEAIALIEHNNEAIVSDEALSLLVYLYTSEGIRAYESKKYVIAEKYLDKAIKADASNKDIVRLLYWARHFNGRSQSLLKYLEQSFSNKATLETANILAELYKKLGREQERENLYLKLYQLYPDNHDITTLLAWSALKRENYTKAENYFRVLVDTFPDNEKFSQNYASILGKNKNYTEALRVLEASPMPRTKNAIQQLNNLYRFFIKQTMEEGRKQDALNYLTRAEKNNAATLELLAIYAWNCYRLGDYICAEKSFASLLQQQPATGEYVDGLIYSLHKQTKNKEAITLIEQHKNIVSAEALSLLVDLYTNEGVRAYESKKFINAEKYLENAVKAGASENGIVRLLHWASHYNGHSDNLLTDLEQSFSDKATLETAKTLEGLYHELGMKEEIEIFYKNIEKLPHGLIRKLTADHYYRQSKPISAAHIYNGPDTCYEGCAEPRFIISAPMRARHGDNGLSKLDSSGAAFKFELPIKTSSRSSINVHQYKISQGSSFAGQYSGQFYKLRQNKSMDVKKIADEYSVRTIEALLHIEGKNNFDMLVGTTPLGGPVSSAPIFTAQVSAKKWHIRIEHVPIKESMLSWIGREDPYSDQVWGRVLKSAVSGQYTHLLPTSYWLSWSAQYAFYEGENTVSNQSVSTSLNVGKTDAFNIFTNYAGLFFNVGGFDKNSNFYTFGHGGYYSPKLNINFGPFIRLATSECDNFYFNSYFSLGYIYQKTEDALRYPENNRATLFLSDPAQNELQGKYRGEKNTGLNAGIKLQGILKLSRNWLLGGVAGFEISEEYKEYNGVLFFGYSFGKNNLCKTKTFSDSFFMH